jgi:hypothetical protein
VIEEASIAPYRLPGRGETFTEHLEDVASGVFAGLAFIVFGMPILVLGLIYGLLPVLSWLRVGDTYRFGMMVTLILIPSVWGLDKVLSSGGGRGTKWSLAFIYSSVAALMGGSVGQGIIIFAVVFSVVVLIWTGLDAIVSLASTVSNCLQQPASKSSRITGNSVLGIVFVAVVVMGCIALWLAVEGVPHSMLGNFLIVVSGIMSIVSPIIVIAAYRGNEHSRTPPGGDVKPPTVEIPIRPIDQ